MLTTATVVVRVWQGASKSLHVEVDGFGQVPPACAGASAMPWAERRREYAVDTFWSPRLQGALREFNAAALVADIYEGTDPVVWHRHVCRRCSGPWSPMIRFPVDPEAPDGLPLPGETPAVLAGEGTVAADAAAEDVPVAPVAGEGVDPHLVEGVDDLAVVEQRVAAADVVVDVGDGKRPAESGLSGGEGVGGGEHGGPFEAGESG